MSGPLMRHQSDISAPVPMPVERVDDTSTVSTSTAETIVWNFVSSGAWAAAVGEAAGTICAAKLTYNGILNSLANAVGSFNDTSLSLGATTRFDTKVTCPESVLSKLPFLSPTDQKAELTPFLATNGYYIIDHRRGMLYGIAKAIVANDTATYKYQSSQVTATITGAVAGDVAHDAVDSGNPVKVGFKAYSFDGSAPGTAVAELDRVNGIADPLGRQYINDIHPNFWDTTADYASAQTNATVKAAPGAGSLFITDIAISNGATAGKITLLDGSGGTVKFTCYPGINGGFSKTFKTPIKLSATTLLAITSTTVTTHAITVSGFIA